MIKDSLLRIELKLLGRLAEAAAHHLPAVQDELNQWPQQGVLVLESAGLSGGLVIRKQNQSLVGAFLDGEIQTLQSETLTRVRFRDPEAAQRTLLLQDSLFQALATQRLEVQGSTALAMLWIRILRESQSALLPEWIARRVLKRPASYTLTLKSRLITSLFFEFRKIRRLQ